MHFQLPRKGNGEMRKDPYKTLGVDRMASDEEIKAAYRDLAKKYHPDNYVGSPLADLAQEKMKEINDAYDTITRERQKQRENEQQQYGTSGDSGAYSETQFADIRELINARNYYEADVRLNAVQSEERSAEWYYLKGLVFMARGWYFEASRHFETACRMAPENAEYRAAVDNMKNTASGYDRKSSGGGCGVCDVCSSLICADCCCEACGGDLIRCC